MPTPRLAAIQDLATRTVLLNDRGDSHRISEYFGVNTFGARQMRDKLPAEVYQKLHESIRWGKKLDAEVAPVLAQVVRDWAISRGATHFTHWFQPQTGLTAEKHDAFLSFDDDHNPLEAFSAEQLIQSEPDASSFPSGGLRATWEARGYTAWNPASPVFIAEWAGVRTLCVPSVFIGYNGEALDEMTPLLRSSDALSQKAVELLELLGDDVHRVYTTLGPEQEYFLIDRTQFALRPDLVMAGRTLVGAQPARGQQLEDHYFGGIPERVQACIAEVEYELYKLGVPIKTRHNEVAPCQFEMAPVFEETDVACDHNMLVMSTLKRVALRHGLQAILHEKPFAGINGSGKHCNWSMQVRSDNPRLDGANLLKPGDTPHQNVRFLIFLAAALQGLHKHAGLLRAGIASSGNEHRLGANEAPPAIISAFMGEMLTRVIDEISTGRTSANAEQAMIRLGVAKLPEIQRDNTDRNRTSPFAFTGQKFEFRAVGSSASIAFPVMILNAAVAEAIGDLTEKLRAEMKKTKSRDDAVLAVVRESFKWSTPVRFEGNNYSDEWVKEAAKRGLPNYRRSPDALDQLVTESSRKLFTELGVLTNEELDSRYHIRLERYSKDLLIELAALREVVDTMILPAAYAYTGSLAQAAAQAKAGGIEVIPQVDAANQVGRMIERLVAGRNALSDAIDDANELHDDARKQAGFLTSEGARCMAAVREVCDELELSIGDEYWPLPKYREMLFPV